MRPGRGRAEEDKGEAEASPPRDPTQRATAGNSDSTPEANQPRDGDGAPTGAAGEG